MGKKWHLIFVLLFISLIAHRVEPLSIVCWLFRFLFWECPVYSLWTFFFEVDYLFYIVLWESGLFLFFPPQTLGQREKQYWNLLEIPVQCYEPELHSFLSISFPKLKRGKPQKREKEIPGVNTKCCTFHCLWISNLPNKSEKSSYLNQSVLHFQRTFFFFRNCQRDGKISGGVISKDFSFF